MRLLINKCDAMEALYILLGFIAVAWLLISELEKRGKLKVERHLILLLLRTEQGKEFIKRAAQHKAWTHIGTLSVVVGILGMIFGLAVLAEGFFSAYILKQPPEWMSSGNGVQVVIPGVTIPFWYGVLGLVSVLLVHEFAHGILAARENVTIKSLGAVLLTAIPIGAFVEPDEEELKAKSRIAKLRVYSIGSFGNIVLALLALFATGFISDNALTAGPPSIIKVSENSPAYGVLEEEMIIKEINGVKISTQKEFSEAVRDLKPNQVLNIVTDRGSFSITTAQKKENPDRGFIGITISPRAVVREEAARYLGESLPFILYLSFYWIMFLNLGIGIMNLAPLHFGIAATDGHLILKELLGRFIPEENADKISLFVSSTLMLAVLLMLLVPAPKPL